MDRPACLDEATQIEPGAGIEGGYAFDRTLSAEEAHAVRAWIRREHGLA